MPTEVYSAETLPQTTGSWSANGLASIGENYRIILALIWLGGVCIFSTVTLRRAAYFHSIKRTAHPAPRALLPQLEECKTQMRLRAQIQLLCSPQIQSPITLGWLRPAIVLPEAAAQQLTAETVKHILLHELGHIKRQDIFFNWVACAVNILHWFNPAVWLACRKMRMDMEVACDALVLSHLHPGQHKNYGATLIEISEIPRVSPRAATTLGILENHTELKARLTMIKEFSTMNSKSKVFVGLILMVSAITTLAQPGLQTSIKNNPPAATTANQPAETSGITLREFAARAEKDLKIKVLVGQRDADVRIQTNIGSEPLDYGQILTQLKINFFTAYKSRDYIQIIPIDVARTLNIPVVEKGKTYYEDEWVTDSIKTEKACAASVVAAIRPLIPFHGHLTVHEDSRTLLIIDTYGNIQRIKSVIKSLEDNLKTPQDCKNIQPPEERPQHKNTK